MKFKKPSMQTLFVIGSLFILWFIQTKEINVSEPLKIISIALLIFPLTFLTIFAIPSIKKSIKNYYKEKRTGINKEINKIKREQGKIEDIEELINLDKEILSLREELRGVQSNKFERNIVLSIIWLILTFFIFYLNLGIYISTPTNMIGAITFLAGLYFLIDMLKTLLNNLEGRNN
jgi:cytochrome c biogenesis protein CcdA